MRFFEDADKKNKKHLTFIERGLPTSIEAIMDGYDLLRSRADTDRFHNELHSYYSPDKLILGKTQDDVVWNVNGILYPSKAVNYIAVGAVKARMRIQVLSNPLVSLHNLTHGHSPFSNIVHQCRHFAREGARLYIENEEKMEKAHSKAPLLLNR